MKHIAHLLAAAHLLANRNEFSNGIVSEDIVLLEYGALDKLDMNSEDDMEIPIENTKEGLETAQSILKSN